MSRTRTMCPFSKKQCISCAQFRGRHYYICFDPQYRHNLSGCCDTTGSRSNGLKRKHAVAMPPVLPKSPKWLTNVEELVERREG